VTGRLKVRKRVCTLRQLLEAAAGLLPGASRLESLAAGKIACPTVVLLVALPLLAGQKAGELPDGKGKSTVQKVCAGCHEIDVVIGARRTQIGWQQNVEDMISRGAEGSDEEMADVVAYLTKYFGKLNVNTASQRQLQDVLGLDEKEAQALIGYREHNGKIKDYEQLKTVPGLSVDKLQQKRSLIAFTL